MPCSLRTPSPAPALLLATILHLAVIIAAGGIALNLLKQDVQFRYKRKNFNGEAHPDVRVLIISCLSPSVVRADDSRLRMQESLIIPFWLCFLFSFPQIALLSWLLKRAPSKRQASLLGASTFMMYVPSFQQRT